jgi:hypothetical protein
VRAATLVLLVVAALLLTSLGGAAILAAPVTLPLLYAGVRAHPTRPFRVAGALVASLTVAEVAWAGFYVLVGEHSPWIAVVPLAAAAVTFAVFFVTPRAAREATARARPG